jgi:hypothetical protein
VQLKDTARSETIGKSNILLTTAGVHKDARIVSVGTTEYTFTIDTSVGNAGYAYIENLDATNYVRWGYSTGVYNHRALPGNKPNIVNLEPTVSAIYLIANVAACDVYIHVEEA